MKKGFLLCFALLVLYFAAVPGSAVPTGATTSSCCQSMCSAHSDCDAICGAGLGRCANLGAPCCRLCVCTFGGT